MAGAFDAQAFTTAFDIGTIPATVPQGTAGARISTETIGNGATRTVNVSTSRTL